MDIERKLNKKLLEMDCGVFKIGYGVKGEDRSLLVKLMISLDRLKGWWTLIG